jgi:translation initiation factor 2A
VWTPNGEHFIVISGMQHATATLYDKNCNPQFEFGKRYRNTIRICPFTNGALIGGFGNLAGEVDIWSLDTHKEIGKTKAYCTVGVEWAPDGKHILTSVLHERVKVDNEVKIFKANGQLMTSLNFKESELYDAQW